MSVKKQLIELLERLIFKITSGRFIFTLVVAGVYAHLAITGSLGEDRINEITLIVLYAYFNRDRTATGINDDDINADDDGDVKKPK